MQLYIAVQNAIKNIAIQVELISVVVVSVLICA